MSARTPLLFATAALLGCPQVHNDCSEYNPFFCVGEGGGLAAATADDTAGPPTSTNPTNPASTTEDTSGPPTSTTDEPTTMPPPDPVCDMDSVCDPGEDILDDCPDCATCGNSVIDGEEQCDDGNTSNQDSCVSCNDARCGDGYRQIGVEACDDGDGNSDEYTGTAHCNTSCTDILAYCGDDVCQTEFEDINSCPEDGCKGMCGNNVVEEGETCDEGGATMTCDADCTEVMCGDGQLNEAAGELCDDGNNDNTDACLTGCIPANCGDGIVQAGVEECDDGNDVETDECDSMCKTIEHRKVFVTSTKYNGNLGGLSGANTKCTMLANMAGLTGQYKAWLSNATEGPAFTFDTSYKGIYELLNGTVIAHGWIGLKSGNLQNEINLDQSGNLTNGNVWTNTRPDGTPVSQANCDSWTSTSPTIYVGPAAFGKSDQTTSTWTNFGSSPCTAQIALYCFEDPK